MKPDLKKKLNESLESIFAEMWIYPFAVLGVICAPIMAGITTNQSIKITFDVAQFIVALVVSAIVVMITELRGTYDEKRSSRIRFSRYAMAFLLGIFWRLVVPVVQHILSQNITDIFGGQ